MSPVKLYYFDITGLGEPIRWILSYGGIKFEEIRFPYKLNAASVPPEIKAKTRWGTVPVVDVDGKIICQSMAISRYFAKQANLIPEDPFQAALSDEYCDSSMDLANVLYPLLYLPDGEDKTKKIEEGVQKMKEKYLNVFDGILNTSKGPFLFGEKLSMADIYLAQTIDQFQITFGFDISEGCENIKAFNGKVRNVKGIKEWLENRPKTSY